MNGLPADSRPLHLHGFDILRIVAAGAVVFGHALQLTGRPYWTLGFADGEFSMSTLGVIVFFAVSGYLVTESWLNTRDLRDFAVKRFLRIWPGLAVMLVLVTFLVMPWLTEGDRYFTRTETWTFLVRNLLVLPYANGMTGAFPDNPEHDIVGTIWTLGPEILAYGMVAAAGALGLLRRAKWLAPLGALALLLVAWAPHVVPQLPYAVTIRALLLSTFLVGMSMRLYSVRPRGILAAIGLAALAGCSLLDAPTAPVTGPLVAYASIWAGTRTWTWAAPVTRLGDPSYGIYIYGFVAQQVLIAQVALVRDSAAWSLTLSLLVSLVLGYLSWHLVERPVMRWGRARLLTPSNSRRSTPAQVHP